MTNYMGTYVQEAGQHYGGVINDHVSIEPQGDSFTVYARNDFNYGSEHKLIPLDRWSYDYPLLEFRGWRDTATLLESASLEEALALAGTEARQRNVALYRQVPKASEILWHPEGWEPYSEAQFNKLTRDDNPLAKILPIR